MSAIDQIKTIVIVMMENRSFDHLLGWMSLNDYGRRPNVEGLTGTIDPQSRELTNLAYDNHALSHRWRPYIIDRDARLVTDVPHEREDVAAQLDYSSIIGDFTMTGFAKAYFDANPGNRGDRPESLMIFPPQLAPMTAFLAQNFAVCDHWFAPLPSSTQPNRFMALAGYSKVASTTNGPPDHDGIIPDWCDRNPGGPIRWRVYREGFSFMTVFRHSVLVNPNFVPFRNLANDFQQKTEDFPEVIVVEPEYDDDPFATQPDDNHGPLPMGPGEAFLSRVYRAVTSNKERWSSTVMVVVYDEHGGFFDHVPPLPIETKAPNAEYDSFKTTGPRVPAIVVSPFVTPGSVCKANFDHTSILRFIAEKFGPAGTSYSPAVEARHADGTLKSLAAALDLPAPRTEPPPPAPDLGPIATVTYAEPRKAATPAQQAFFNARMEGQAEYPGGIADNHPEMLFHAPNPDAPQS